MINVLRNVKKQGFSSLEDFNLLASPVTYDSDAECMTPVDSPLSDATDQPKHEEQDPHQQRAVNDEEVASSSIVASTMTGRLSFSAMKSSSFRSLLSTSPETRSRQLLSLSPVPRVVTLPRSLSLPEQMLSVFSLYLKGCFEAGVWRAGADGIVLSRKGLEGRQHWPADCVNAVGFHNEHK